MSAARNAERESGASLLRIAISPPREHLCRLRLTNLKVFRQLDLTPELSRAAKRRRLERIVRHWFVELHMLLVPLPLRTREESSKQ